ncbi:MAG: hypothetical protein R2883_08030 [Caldisericia bacterium]
MNPTKHSNMVAVLSKKCKNQTSKGEVVFKIDDGWIEVFHNRVIIWLTGLVPVLIPEVSSFVFLLTSLLFSSSVYADHADDEVAKPW